MSSGSSKLLDQIVHWPMLQSKKSNVLAESEPAECTTHLGRVLPRPAVGLAGIFCQNISASLCHATGEASAFCPLTIQKTEVTGRQQGLHQEGVQGNDVSVWPCTLRKSAKLTQLRADFALKRILPRHFNCQMSGRAGDINTACRGFDKL